MSTVTRRLGVGALVVGGLILGAPAQAQNPYPNYNNPYLAQQQAYNAAAQRALFAQQAGVFSSPIANQGINPYTPIAPVGPVGGGIAPATPYDAFANPYTAYVDPYGGYLRGQADYVRAVGETTTAIERARILREQALQAKADTAKKRFDTWMYIRENTPTYTEEEAKRAKAHLKRIQNGSTPAEIVNGKAMDVLLRDLRKYPAKKVALENIPISEETLKQINVIKANGNLGLLRDQGKFTWPLALQELLPPAKMKEIDSLTQTVYKSAAQGKININAYKDLRTNLDEVRETLSGKVNAISTSQYLEAKRFLNDFDDARAAMEKGEVSTQEKYRDFIAGGKTIQEVIDFLVSTGYKIAPAVAGDEAAYQALHSAMVALDVAVNTQYAPSDSKEPSLP